MSVKHVQDYLVKVTNDYKMMKDTLQELENSISEGNAKIAIQNIDIIKQQVEKLKENYMRISYIVFLLNQPNKKEKQKKYLRQNKEKLKAIPNEHTLEGIQKENTVILNSLKKLNIGNNC